MRAASPDDIFGTHTALWKQLRRWTTGLAQVLRHHRGVMRRWQSRRLWPVYVEASISVLWSHAFVGTLSLQALCLAFGATPPPFALRPMTWGLLLGVACLAQLATGVYLDAKYDPSVRRSMWLAPVYPLLYWLMMAAATVRSTIPALLRAPPELAHWSTVRTDTTRPRADVTGMIPAPRMDQPVEAPAVRQG